MLLVYSATLGQDLLDEKLSNTWTGIKIRGYTSLSLSTSQIARRYHIDLYFEEKLQFFTTYSMDVTTSTPNSPPSLFFKAFWNPDCHGSDLGLDKDLPSAEDSINVVSQASIIEVFGRVITVRALP
ncbi:hypothetical protein FRC18_006552 [Serendipita sp. 400]|nr:hypothetical protein FRC18_006552 [Serendipita sp. 400]